MNKKTKRISEYEEIQMQLAENRRKYLDNWKEPEYVVDASPMYYYRKFYTDWFDTLTEVRNSWIRIFTNGE